MFRRILTSMILFLFLHANFDFVLIISARGLAGSKTAVACCCANCSEFDGRECPCCETEEASEAITGTTLVYKACDPLSNDASIQYTAFVLCKFFTKRLTRVPENKPQEKEWQDASSMLAKYDLGAPLFHPP